MSFEYFKYLFFEHANLQISTLTFHQVQHLDLFFPSVIATDNMFYLSGLKSEELGGKNPLKYLNLLHNFNTVTYKPRIF